MCSLPGHHLAMLFLNLGSASRSRSRCPAVSHPIATSLSHHEITKPLRVRVSELCQLECSIDCVNICAVLPGTATGTGSHWL